MEITRGYQTELQLNNKQRTRCLQHAGCARFAYNWGCAGNKKPLLHAKRLLTPSQ
jgi:hypothetical protein